MKILKSKFVASFKNLRNIFRLLRSTLYIEIWLDILQSFMSHMKDFFRGFNIKVNFNFFYVGPPKEDIFPGHLLSPIFQSSYTLQLQISILTS